MRLYWTLRNFPELAHLPPARRAELIHQSMGWRATIGLWLRSVVFGLIFTAGASGCVVWPILRLFTKPEPAVTWITMGLWPLLALACYQYSLLRIRANLRLTLKREFAGQRLPVCIECGYHLRGGDDVRCPECGANVVVPPSRYSNGPVGASCGNFQRMPATGDRCAADPGLRPGLRE